MQAPGKTCMYRVEIVQEQDSRVRHCSHEVREGIVPMRYGRIEVARQGGGLRIVPMRYYDGRWIEASQGGGRAGYGRRQAGYGRRQAGYGRTQKRSRVETRQELVKGTAVKPFFGFLRLVKAVRGGNCWKLLLNLVYGAGQAGWGWWNDVARTPTGTMALVVLRDRT